MKITVVGLGYVGMSLSVLLSRYNEVVAYDIMEDRVDKVNNKISTVKDKEIEEYLKNEALNLRATLDYEEAFINSKYIIICTPTNYDEYNNCFDTSSVENIIKKVMKLKINTTIVVKSTIPVGFIENMKKKYNIDNIMFSPEFLREGKALYDNLYPSRIIVGEKSKKAEEFANLLKQACLKDDVIIKYTDSTEAEAIKLFANTYLALRVAYFNELDTYAECMGLNTKDIIDGVCLDPRIGDYYNNPSFGYGGYCLPKDTKQLLSNYKSIPENIIEAVIKSNDTRKKYIADVILKTKPKVVGIYRLNMKSDSDNFRTSAVQTIIDLLKEKDVQIVIYEPELTLDDFSKIKVINDLDEFKSTSDVIIANRIESNLNDCLDKVYSRDIYMKD